MNKLSSLSIYLIAFLCISLSSQAQEIPDSAYKTVSHGFATGIGFGENTGTRYKPIFLMGDFSWQFKPRVKKVFLSWYFEPQFNIVLTERPIDLEFGANLGFRNYIRLNPGLYFYQMIGSGPHYFTADVERQVQGFLFSDNFAAGVYTKISGPTFLNLQFRFRHLSNASINHPNSGINTFNILVGLANFGRSPHKAG
jgi:hypothetical protein